MTNPRDKMENTLRPMRFANVFGYGHSADPSERYSLRGRVEANGQGFTIVELMIVVLILGLLATAVVVNVSGYSSRSRKERARMDIASLKSAVELFNLQYSRFPTNEEGLGALLCRTAEHPSGIISELPLDPWGRIYMYACPGEHGAFDIVSFGRDGVQGGEGEDADIESWQLGGKANDE